METCWFWETACAIDYAGWVQAFGTIIAILFAWGVGYWESHKGVKHNLEQFDVFLSYFQSNLIQLLESLEDRNRAECLKKLKLFEEIKDYGKAIDLTKLPIGARIALLEVNRYLTEAIMTIDSDGLKVEPQFIHATSQYESILDEVTRSSDRAKAILGIVPSTRP